MEKRKKLIMEPVVALAALGGDRRGQSRLADDNGAGDHRRRTGEGERSRPRPHRRRQGHRDRGGRRGCRLRSRGDHDDGNEIDVHLDKDFNFVDVPEDGENETGQDDL